MINPNPKICHIGRRFDLQLAGWHATWQVAVQRHRGRHPPHLPVTLNTTISGRLHFIRKHITEKCQSISSEDRAIFMKSVNDKDSPVDLTDDMKASSQRRFVMKSETRVDETATKRKKYRIQNKYIYGAKA